MSDLRIDRGELRDQIERQRDNVLDLEAVVDERRRAVDAHRGEYERDAQALDEAVAERDRGATYLAHLIALYAGTEPV